MLTDIKRILNHAVREGYSLGAFNTSNLEVTQAIIEAAHKKRSPIIIQTTETALHYAGMRVLPRIVKEVAKTTNRAIPIGLHLDHGRSLVTIKECLKLGYSSVMLDASNYPFKENVRLTGEATKLAHSKGAICQGEIGGMPGREDWERVDREELLTDPDQAVEFVRQTNIDTLAVSLGTIHGAFKGKEKIDLKRLGVIQKKIPVPLVLHGVSGVSFLDLKKAFQKGIRIANIDTDMRIAFVVGMREGLKKEDHGKKDIDPRMLLTYSKERIRMCVEKHLDNLGSSGRT